MLNKITEIRKMQNITQQQLANATGISISQLANIEKNRNICSVEIALKIGKELDKKVEEIFILENKKNE